VQIQYEYDAVGNRRRMWTQYNHVIERTRVTADYWYEYDAADRFTVSMGQLSGGARATSANDGSIHVIAGSSGEGVQLAYNAAGERVLARYAGDGRTEAYSYDANGALTDERINGVLVRQRTNDALGQVTHYTEWSAAGTQKTQDVKRTWNLDGQLQQENDALDGSTTMYTRLRDGTLTKVVRSNLANLEPTTTVTTTYEYQWYDVAKLKRVTTQASNPQAPGWKPSVSTYTYDGNANLKSVYDDGGGDTQKQRAVLYRTDGSGRVLRRDEVRGATLGSSGNIIGGTASHEHAYYYFDGQRVADFGDDGTEKVDYAQQLSGAVDRGEQRYRYSNPVLSSDVGGGYEGVSGTYPLMSPDKWTVSAGQTLQSVAQAVWGDAGLWYVLAGANGLTGEETLKSGQVLSIPNRITNVHNSSQTFRTYDPGRAIGNTQPTLPDAPPPVGGSGGGHGCGGVGNIITVVVAAFASVVSMGALAPMMGGIAAGAFAGGMSAAMASDNPNGPQLKEVAQGAMGGAVSGGFASSGVGGSLASSMGGLGETGSQIAAQAVMGAGRSALTQGLGVLTGLQGHVDWKGVAAGAIASGSGYGVGMTPLGQVPVVGGIASGLAAGAASTLARGGSLTNNLAAITADAVASTVGNMVLGQVAQASAGKIATTGSASMSTLYGVGGNYDDLVRQATQQSYGVNAGDQFAGMANWDLANGLLNSGSTFDTTAASLGLTTEAAHRLMASDNGRSIAGSPFSPEVTAYAVPYPQIAVRPLLDGNAGTIRNLNGLESFMAFNPLGQALGGAADHVSAMANGLWNVVTHPGDTAEAIGAHYGNAYAAGTLGDTVLGDVGGVLTGAVRSSPLGLVDAMYHQDQAGAAYRMGGAAVDATLFAGPSLAAPAMEAGATMFGPKLAGWAENYAAKSGILSYVSDNVSVRPVGEIGASAGSRQGGFIFRGDGRGPDVIFQEGLQPKGPNQDLYRYAAENVDSVFVSTSKSPNIAREFASYQGEGYVYTIRGHSASVDVNAVLGNRSPFPHEREIAVPGGVRPTGIMGGRLVGPDGTFIGPFIKNPGYTR
jgi:YD repeat-containing protein